jgi:hypothetical protein
LVLLAYPVALAAHGVSAVASAHAEHRDEHYSANKREDENERKHGEHTSAKRERDPDSRGPEARAGDQSGSDKPSAVVTAARVKTQPEPIVVVQRPASTRPHSTSTAIAAAPQHSALPAPPSSSGRPNGPAGAAPPPLFAPPLPVVDGAIPVTPAPPLNLAVVAVLVIAGGLTTAAVLTARRRI